MKNELNPLVDDELNVHWDDVWTILLPYYAQDYQEMGTIDNLDPYLIEAAETDNDVECRQLLLFLGIVSIRKAMYTGYKPIGSAISNDRFDNAPDGSSTTNAADYLLQALLKIYDGTEPNKAFGWTKPTRGPRKRRKFEKLLAVAVPELQRRNRMKEIGTQLKESNISRRQRQLLNTELANLKGESHLKLRPHTSKPDNTEYALRTLQDTLAKQGQSARAVITLREMLEKIVAAPESMLNPRRDS